MYPTFAPKKMDPQQGLSKQQLQYIKMLRARAAKKHIYTFEATMQETSTPADNSRTQTNNFNPPEFKDRYFAKFSEITSLASKYNGKNKSLRMAHQRTPARASEITQSPSFIPSKDSHYNHQMTSVTVITKKPALTTIEQTFIRMEKTLAKHQEQFDEIFNMLNKLVDLAHNSAETVTHCQEFHSKVSTSTTSTSKRASATNASAPRVTSSYQQLTTTEAYQGHTPTLLEATSLKSYSMQHRHLPQIDIMKKPVYYGMMSAFHESTPKYFKTQDYPLSPTNQPDEVNHMEMLIQPYGMLQERDTFRRRTLSYYQPLRGTNLIFMFQYPWMVETRFSIPFYKISNREIFL